MRKAGKVAVAILAVVSIVTVVLSILSRLSHNSHCDDDFENGWDMKDFEPWLDEDIED